MPVLFNVKTLIPKKLGVPWKRRQDGAVPAWRLKFKHLQPLKPVFLPQVLPDHQQNLAEQGWACVEFCNAQDPLQTSFQELLQASQAFFELPDEYKQEFKTQLGTEEGWKRVEGEKEFITLRSIEKTPDVLKDAASKYWAAAGSLLNEQLGRIAESLGLPAESLITFSEPCSKLGTESTATMLRLFRYEGYDGFESKTVAEEHKDLGLLSLVVGDTPGLEVWDRDVERWYCIEKSYRSKSAASLLVGRQLERLSNNRYFAGGHRVRSYSDPGMQRIPTSVEILLKYRYSIVFVLRAHLPTPVNTDDLTTDITGEFKQPLRDITARDMFNAISSAHFNINTHIEEREEQRRKLAEKTKKGAKEEETPAGSMKRAVSAAGSVRDMT